jgi:hypothetical protein
MKFLQALRMQMLLVGIVGLFVAGCGESDGPADKAGKAIDSAVESTTSSVGDAMESTGDASTGAAEDAGEAMSDPMDSTGDAMKDAGKTASEGVGLKD